MLEKLKNKPVLFYISMVFVLVQVMGFVLSALKLITMDLLPGAYLAAYIAIAVGMVMGQILLCLLVFKKPWGFIVVIFVSCIVSAGTIWAYCALTEVENTIDYVTDNSDEVVTEMAIIVLKDAAIEDITQMDEYIIGYVNGIDEDATVKVKDEINLSLGEPPRYVAFNTIMDVTKALFAKSINAMVINSSYIDIIKEMEEYADFDNMVSLIYSTEVKGTLNMVDEGSKNYDSFVVYISGIDKFGAVSVLSRSDVNILMAVNTKTKTVQLVSTPRDFYVELPNSNGMKDKLTHAGMYGLKNSIGAIEKLYGIDIDYYVKMNFSGFEAIIDSLDGIDVYSEYEFTVEPIKHYVVGMNHLNGIEALAFARERYALAGGDRQRGANQMAVIKATINKMTSPTIIYRYDKVLESIGKTVQTNFTSDELYGLVKMQIKDMAEWDIRSYSVTGKGDYDITYTISDREVYVMVPDMNTVNEAKQLIENTLAGVK